MEIGNKAKEKLHLDVENEKTVMKMEHNGAKMILHFAVEPPELDVKKAIVDILTSQYMRRISK